MTMEPRVGDQVERGMKMKVMVAIDESDGSFYALKWALDNLFVPMAAVEPLTPDPGPQGNHSSLFLVHVQPTLYPPVYPVGPAAYVAPAVMDAVKKAQEEISARILTQALQMCKDKQVRAESVIMNGDPREMICQAAEKMQVDMLVMGSRGLGTFKRAILGSVSDYCAHHAKTPILIVKPHMELHHKH
ncbi:universal stress protein A-like protein [Prosopis cineraria]|uniref:universal stress protein A-like protein n=1 Tax=Prosopis cineraria TaxID=364024 RepID=UPI00240F8D4A|nr:universal stress protein A-like protein [Prosopis cineraria]